MLLEKAELVPIRAVVTRRRLERPALLLTPLADLARVRLSLSPSVPLRLELELVGPTRSARGRRFRTDCALEARILY